MSRSEYDYEVNFDYDAPGHYEQLMTEHELALEARIDALDREDLADVDYEPPQWFLEEQAEREAEWASVCREYGEGSRNPSATPGEPLEADGFGHGPPPLTDDDVPF